MRQLPLLLIVLSFAAAQIPPANAPAPFGEIAAVKQQMLALRRAELHYDAPAAAKLFADNFLLTTTDRNLKTKEQFLKVIGDKSNPLELFEYSEMEIRVYDATAVVFSRLHEKGFMDGKPFELNGRPTWTWVRQKGAWVCVAAHD